METFDILVPRDRQVRTVIADGLLAAYMGTHYTTGTPYEIQTWDANLGYPPKQIMIEFE